MRSWFIHSSRTVLLHSKNKQAEYRANFPKSRTKEYQRRWQIPATARGGRHGAIQQSRGPVHSLLQILSGHQLQNLHALQLSCGEHFSGVTSKIMVASGIKTISVRSLGAQHTAVTYNGVAITDVQTGQIDIGRFSLDNVEQVALYTGQNDQIFLPATAFASASSLAIRSATPHFDEGERINGNASVKGGSFGLFNPSIHINTRINNIFSATLGSEWMTAKGDYPYRLNYGIDGVDSSSMERRENSDVNSLRVEAALFGNFSLNTKADLRAYYYQSERGLPGATIYYNTENFSKQRLWDRTFFLQGNIEHAFSNKWIIQGNAKYNRGYLRYLDPTYLGAGGKYEDIFNQHETYGSVSLLYRAFSGYPSPGRPTCHLPLCMPREPIFLPLPDSPPDRL